MQKIISDSDKNFIVSLLENEKRVFVIADRNLSDELFLFRDAEIITIDSCEENKSLSTVEFIIESLLQKGADRGALLVGFGGGIITDICGFTASIFKRGIRFAYIPTTLLAQCDAAIGGKNGVNFGSFKNILGTINLPEWVFVSPDFLKTLPAREIKNGFAEILKTFIICDKDAYYEALKLFCIIEGKLSAGKEINSELARLGAIADKCRGYKLKIVEEDLLEHGRRRLLNLGHTFAHAIESCCYRSDRDSSSDNVTVSHGEAVSIGIVFAAKLSEQLGLADKGLSVRMAEDFKSVGLPVSASWLHLSSKKVFDAMTKDKKADSGAMHFILPQAIGNVKDELLEINIIEKIADDLCKFE